MKIGNKPELPQAAAAKPAQKSATTVATEESTRGLPERAAGVPVSFSSSARALDHQSRANTDFDAIRNDEEIQQWQAMPPVGRELL